MSNFKSTEVVETERELWNTAKIYSITHVAEPLIRCRKLITVCLFGVDEIGKEIGLSKSQINNYRVEAMNRLMQELKILIMDNIIFVKRKQHRTDLEKCLEELKEVENVIDGVSFVTTDQRTNLSMIKINKELSLIHI